MPSSYICHYGITGQKWYIRRFQNPDGSLTSAGKKRYAKLQAQSESIETKKKQLFPQDQPRKTPNPHGKKSVFDMTDDEIRSEISRLSLEKQYRDYMKDLYPPKKKKQALVDGRKIVGDILTGSLTTVGKSVATNVMGNQVNKLGKQLGLEYSLYKPEKEKQNQERKSASNPTKDVVSDMVKNKNKSKGGR